MKLWKTLFTRHPREVGMSYSQHLGYALSVTARLGFCSTACFLHAFFPFLFTTTTSAVVGKLNEEFIAHQSSHHES